MAVPLRLRNTKTHPLKGVFCQLLLAELRQGIDTLTSIHRLDRHQHAHLRRDLDHRSALRQARSNAAQSGGVGVLQWIRSLAPRADSNSITYSSILSPATPISSTNLGCVFFRRRTEPSADPFTRFLRVL